jgi:hypothetical protein
VLLLAGYVYQGHNTSSRNLTMAPTTCEFPRCYDPSDYGFSDEKGIARFCSGHKTDGMVLVHAFRESKLIMNVVVVDTIQAEEAAKDSDKPEDSSLEFAREFIKLEPEIEAILDAPLKAERCRAEIKKLGGTLHQEDQDIHEISKSLEKLEVRINRQGWKPNLGGKSLFGRGILSKDQKVIDKMVEDKEASEAKVEDLKQQKETHEVRLRQLKDELPELEEVEHGLEALEASMGEMREAVIDAEATLYLRMKRKMLAKNKSLIKSLRYVTEDVAKAHNQFKVALQLQQSAARSNAMGGGANIGQAIGGGGGRGFGNSPGERLLQIKRNQETKKSIDQAQSACDILATGQKRIPDELRERLGENGTVEVPDLWHGAFGRDMIVGAVAGNVGDAVNHARARRQITKNMQELEKIIQVTERQLDAVVRVEDDLKTEGGAIQKEIDAEGDKIFERVKAVAKESEE